MNDTTPDNHDNPRQVAASRDESRLVATDHGLSRQVATDRDLSQYTITIEEAITLFTNAGVSRDKRTIERYCEHSKIDAVKLFSEFGPKWYLNPESVDGTIKKLQQFADAKKQATTSAPTPDDIEARQPDDGRALSGHAAASPDKPRQEELLVPTLSQPVVPVPEVTALEQENKRLKEDILDLKIDNRGLTKTVNTLVEEVREFARERREIQAERKTWMAQIGEMTTRLLQLSSGHDRPTPAPAEVIHARVIEVDAQPAANPHSDKPGVDNSVSEIIT
jgi:hypothetical protein